MGKAYVLPFVLYLLGTTLISRFEGGWYALAYGCLAVVLATVYWQLLRGRSTFKPHWRVAWGVVFGLVGIVIWIALSHLQLEQYLTQFLPGFLRPEERVGFNPFEKLGNGWEAWAFIGGRLLGIAILVPLAEELFWRGFLLRWLIDPEWEKVPVGEYSLSSCATVVLLFTLAHPEWLAAAIYCTLLNALLYWKKDLWLCMVAHAVSNLVLAIYVLYAGQWWLW